MEPTPPTPSPAGGEHLAPSNDQLTPMEAQAAPAPEAAAAGQSAAAVPTSAAGLPSLPADPAASAAPIASASATPATPLSAADVDVIEKEWVDKAEDVIKKTAGDPHAEEEAVEAMQVDYLKKRYGRDVNPPQDS
jgi:hypothetical protein